MNLSHTHSGKTKSCKTSDGYSPPSAIDLYWITKQAPTTPTVNIKCKKSGAVFMINPPYPIITNISDWNRLALIEADFCNTTNSIQNWMDEITKFGFNISIK